MKFREVLLLIVLIGAGLIVYQVQTNRWDLHFTWDEDFFWLGSEYVYEETEVFDAPIPTALTIVNGHGWVAIEGSDEDVARLTFKKRIWRKNEEDARTVADELRYSVERTSGRLSLSTNREEFRRRNFETGFILSVPRGTAVSVKNAYGYVTVSDVREATVENRHGRVFLSRIEGSSKIETSYDDVEIENIGAECGVIAKHADVKAFSVGGDLTIETSYAKVSAEDLARSLRVMAPHTEVFGRRIAGTVDIEISYEDITLREVGPTKIRARHSTVDADEVRGDLDIETTYERVKASNVHGSLSVVGTNVGVSGMGVDGPRLVVDTSYEPVNLTEFSAEASIRVRNGDIILAPRTLAHPIDVQAEYAKIDFHWPEGEEAPVEARSKGGDVKWGLRVEPTVRQTNGVSLVKAFEGRSDKPQVLLSTSYGDIRIDEKPRVY